MDEEQYKKELLEECNHFAIISLPQGVFTSVGSNNKTNLLFFEKGKPTKEIWYYELTPPPGVKYTKKNQILDKHTADVFDAWEYSVDGENSWKVNVNEIIARNYDLSAKNPKKKQEGQKQSVEELLESLSEEKRIRELLIEIGAIGTKYKKTE